MDEDKQVSTKGMKYMLLDIELTMISIILVILFGVLYFSSYYSLALF